MAQVLNAIYVGEFADDVAAKTYINSTQFMKDAGFKKAADVVWTAMFYSNTTIGGFRIWNGAAWDDFGAGSGGVITGIKVVTKNGNDTLGDGSLTKPYLTIQAAITDLGVGGGAVLTGPGTYTEQLALTTSVDIIEMTPGTVTIDSDIVGGAVVTLTPAAVSQAWRIKANIVNTSNLTVADIALHVDNSGGLGSCEVTFGGETLSAGLNGTALKVDGIFGNVKTDVLVDKSVTVLGAIDLDLQAGLVPGGSDVVHFKGVEFGGSLNTWMEITGGGGNVLLGTSILAVAANGETIDFGANTACGVTLEMGSSYIAGTLSLNNNGGAGVVILTASTQVGTIVPTLANQTIHRWLGGDDILVQLLNIDIAAGGTHTIYTPPAGRIANPFEVRLVNTLIGAPTGVAFSYSFDGSGAGSVVAVVGAAAVVVGVTNCVVVIDAFPNPTPLTFTVVAAGAAGDTINVEAVVKVSLV